MTNKLMEGNSHETIVMEPAGFNESPEVVSLLLAGKAIILNLHLLENVESQRMTEFLAGACRAAGAIHQQLGEGMLLIAPATFPIRNLNGKHEGLAWGAVDCTSDFYDQ